MNATPRRVGALDLGSNSFHLQVAELPAPGVDPTGPLALLDAVRAPVRLGVLEQGRIPPEAEAAAGEALEALITQARALGCTALTAAGTAAFRDAANGAEVALRLSQRAGLPLRVLGGEDEARLIFLGVWSRVGRPGERLLAVDLGGRSTELALGDAEGLAWGVSLPLGHLREPESPAPPEARVLAALAPHRTALAGLRWDRVVCTAGTALTLVHMATLARGEPAPSRHGLRAAVPELRALLTRLRTHPAPESLPGWDTRRAATFLFGASLGVALLEQLGVPDVHSSEAALREGLLEEARRRAPDTQPAPG